MGFKSALARPECLAALSPPILLGPQQADEWVKKVKQRQEELSLLTPGAAVLTEFRIEDAYGDVVCDCGPGQVGDLFRWTASQATPEFFDSPYATEPSKIREHLEAGFVCPDLTMLLGFRVRAAMKIAAVEAMEANQPASLRWWYDSPFLRDPYEVLIPEEVRRDVPVEKLVDLVFGGEHPPFDLWTTADQCKFARDLTVRGRLLGD
jgi:hypothetical protein